MVQKTQKKPVIVAMSGGVDSSVAAGMMRDQGHEVIGITLQLYDHGAAINRKGTCCAGRDIHDARNVAARLGIAHYVLDFEKRFRSEVIDDFADSYIRGETPVPCVRCNQHVKFNDLLSVAKKLGASCLVTGHYVRRGYGDGKYSLMKGRDATKDQSYFLFATTQEQLSFLRFPLGEMTKAETRMRAHEYGLSVAEKSDSQDICFVPDGNYRDIILKLRPEAFEKGDIIDLSGRILGQHQGIANYTVGQRRGLGLGGHADPLYVLALRPEERQVVVGPVEKLGKTRIILKQLNWIAHDISPHHNRDQRKGIAVSAKCRSTMPEVTGRLFFKEEAKAELVLDIPYQGIAPGQACVFYQEEKVLGGGWIVHNQEDNPTLLPQQNTIMQEYLDV